MAIYKRIELGSAVRRVKLKQPKDAPEAPPVLAFEHIYRELILISEGGTDNSLPPSQPGLPEVGVPGFPDAGFPEDQPEIDNSLPWLPSGGWPGCPSVDNSLPHPPYTPDNALPEDQPEVNNDLPEGDIGVNPR